MRARTLRARLCVHRANLSYHGDLQFFVPPCVLRVTLGKFGMFEKLARGARR